MAAANVFWVVLLVAGVATLVSGLRARTAAQRILAPLGVLGIATGARHLLAGVVPGVVLLSLGGIALAGVVYWSAQLDRQDQSGDAGSR